MSVKRHGKNTVETVWDIAKPLADELGLILWDVRFEKEGSSWYLNIFIDKDGDSVGIEDCVNMSHALDKPLDDEDPIEQSYSLQVASPGVERDLIRDFHFECFMGENIKIKLIRPLDGKREFCGKLTDYSNGNITIETENGLNTFNKKETSWVRLDDFGGF